MSLRPNSQAEVRRKNYKVGVNVEEARRKREDTIIEIRKNKREENLQKKRRHGIQSTQQVQFDLNNKLDNFPAMVAGVHSSNPTLQLEATTQFRKFLSIDRCPRIEEVVDVGVVPRFVDFLTRHDFPQLQFEAAWALTNIASGTSEQTRVVIDHGAVPHFVQLISSPRADIREQAVWALGNIAGDSTTLRDLILSHGALMPILAQLNEDTKLMMLRNVAFMIHNICRGNPQAPFEQTKPALTALARLIHSDDEEILSDTCWALSYMSDGTNDKIKAVIDSGVCPRLVKLLLYPSSTVLIPTIRTVGNIVTGHDLQTQVLIDNQVLPYLLPLLTDNPKKIIRKEACWAISNITAGNKDQIQAVIDAYIIPPLVKLLQTAEFDIMREAAWAIANATIGGSHEQIKYIVDQGCIKPLCDLLDCKDPKCVSVCLEGLSNILEAGEKERQLRNTGVINLYAQYIADAEGLEKLENLQTHDNSEIYAKVLDILEIYWEGGDEDCYCLENDDENQNVATNGTDGQAAFNFGANQAQTPLGGFTFD